MISGWLLPAKWSRRDRPGRVSARQHPNVLRGVGPQRKATKGRSTCEKSGFGTLLVLLSAAEEAQKQQEQQLFGGVDSYRGRGAERHLRL